MLAMDLRPCGNTAAVVDGYLQPPHLTLAGDPMAIHCEMIPPAPMPFQCVVESAADRWQHRMALGQGTLPSFPSASQVSVEFIQDGVEMD